MLAFRREALPTLRYLPNDTELALAGIALRPTSFLCPSRTWGRGEPGKLAT